MKNVYEFPYPVETSCIVPPSVPSSMQVVGYDKSSAEAYEKLNPVLSNGHRVNPITVILDPNVPKEVSQSLLQFIQKQPAGTNYHDMTDDELMLALPSRYMQSQPQLDGVRDALISLASYYGVGDPAPSDPAPSDPAPSDPAPIS